jgi:hypothetical protein
MDFAIILVPIFVFVLIKIALDQRSQARTQNVKLLEEALKSPQVDRPTLEALTFQLTGKRAARREGTNGFMAFLLAIGWIALFTGIALVVVSSLIHSEDLLVAGSIVGIVGFAFVTYPFALRELEARRQA